MASKEENSRKLALLPPRLQEIFLSENFSDRFAEIALRHTLSSAQSSSLTQIVGEGLLSGTPPFELRTQLASALKIPPQRFDPLFQDVTQKLLSPFQQTESSSLPTQPTPAPAVAHESPASSTQTPAPLLTHVAQFQERKKQREEELKKGQNTGQPNAQPSIPPPTSLH